ncbi:MBL fold metallo-hydrolase [Alkaliphilus oremlandii]|uniref:Beta-lactamase domain protein n=1 Tax=Alkaliphilus oremlandii (strain OhILAs) TaxID=350688 RepID=A8MGM9_ALKOO|nr:MBL fold metallo-hydrolase [Alkaliphilus oremlandii]ABW19252.1 beta-lactamase domain protein [Alkaliphilus oremlandii OhILAs]
MFLEKVPAGVYAVNCYVIGDEQTNKAAVVDPGGDVDKIIKVLENNDLELKYILLTHAHGDHIGGLVELRERTGAPVYIHQEDLYMLQNSSVNYSQAISGVKIETNADGFLNDGDRLELGDLTLSIIHTPGHSKGGICIAVGNVLLTGDTLFANSIGRSDLYGGNQEELIQSIKNKLFTLDEDLTVLPGHGPATTIRIEKITNPYVR